MENSIEEDIKILEELRIANERCIRNTKIEDTPFVAIWEKQNKALEHILSDYKRVLKENEKLNKLHIQDNKHLDFIMEHSIPFQKVKDKIRHYQELQDNYIKKYDEINEGLQAMISALQELLESEE